MIPEGDYAFTLDFTGRLILLGFAVLGMAMAYMLSRTLTGYLVKRYLAKGQLDIPNARSSHSIPTPRGGGLGLLVGALVAMALVALGLVIWGITEELLPLYLPHMALPGLSWFGGVLVMAVVGWLDDRKGLKVSHRFGVQFGLAILITWATGGLGRFPLPEPLDFLLPVWINWPLTVFWIVAVINLFNFLDGIDGYAGSQTLLAGLALAFVGGNLFIPGLLLALAAGGFLKHNWHKASIFMGDIGSLTLGFVFATLPLYTNSVSPHLAVFMTIIFLWFFLSDGAFTLLRRLLQGHKIWEAHRTHLYQRWVIAGASHAQVTKYVMGTSALLSGISLVVFHYKSEWLLYCFVVALILFLGYFVLVTRLGNRNKGSK